MYWRIVNGYNVQLVVVIRGQKYALIQYLKISRYSVQNVNKKLSSMLEN